MANNSSNSGSSPLDLGKLIIDGNHAMLQNSNQDQGQAVLNNLLNKNPATGLTDDQASALAAVVKTAHKEHAQEAYQQLGPDNAAALLALHNITSPSQTKEGGTSSNMSMTQAPAVQPQAQPTQQQQISNQAMNNAQTAITPNNPARHPLGFLLNTIGNMTGVLPAQEAMNSLRLSNTRQAQEIAGVEPMQQKDKELTAYQQGELGIKKATMLMDYGGKVSQDFQATIQPHIDTINAGLTVDNLYKNVLADPNNQQAQQAFLEASAQLQGVKNAKDLLRGRSAIASGFGALNQGIMGGGGFQIKELNRIQKANMAKYATSQAALQSLTDQHQKRLKKLGLDPDQFVNKYSQSNQIQEGATATNPQTGQKITFRGGKWQ